MMPYFIWKGKDSRDMGIWISQLPPPTRAQERTTSVTVPGRSGSLQLLEDEAVHDDVLMECQCFLRSDIDKQNVIRWLTGSGLVIFSNEPDYSRKGRIIEQITFDHFANDGSTEFSVQWQCEPYKAKYPPKPNITVSSSGQYITNPGDVPSMPKITVNGSGAVTLTVGGTAVGLNLTIGTMVLDWESGVVTNAAGTTSLAAYVTGGPQRIPVGRSRVTWASVNNGTVSSVVIEPRWRWL